MHELQNGLCKIKDPWKVLLCEEQRVILGYISKDGDVTIKVTVDEALEFTIEYLSLELPVNHPIYKEYKRRVAKIPIQWLLKSVVALSKCDGITDLKLKEYGEQCILDRKHNCEYGLHKSKDDGKISTVLRSNTCLAFISKGDVCEECNNVIKQLKRKLDLADRNKNKPITAKTPLRKVTADRLSQAIKDMRLSQKKLQTKIEELSQQIETNGIQLDAGLHNDFQNLIENVKQELPEDSFEKLFWEQQQKAFQSNPKGIRWHPMMVRFALHIHLRSPSTYKALRESGVMKLPSERTLRDYSIVFHPSPGFKKETFEDLRHQASKLQGTGKYVVLAFDEVSIKDDLVFDKHNGELIGFVNLGKDLNDLFGADASTDFTKSIASHALVFMVVGLASRLKFSIGYFGTRSVTSDMLYPLLWKSIGFCETYAGLKVICVVSDKASANQKLYRMHSTSGNIVYHTKNVFAIDEDREIYFFSDPPHLLKTARNNLASSGFQKSRLLWNQKDILWKHIVDIYEADRISLVRKLPKLSNEHINLNSYSKMRVNLAAQVMSETVAKVMSSYGPDSASETVKFILMIDKFFDCCNSRSLKEAEHKRKPFLAPYVSVSDDRFVFLKDVFLKYLDEWKDAVDKRPGNFSKEDRARMFLSNATFEGLKTTSLAMIDCVKFLLEHGCKYVLTNKVSQDPLEDHFGRHRGLARRSNNPTLYALGFQENKLRVQRSIATSITPKGNTKGSKRPAEKITITTSPLNKRKTKSEV